MSTLDPNFSPEIFRKNFPQVIAKNRQLASLMPVRLAYSASGYAAGTVLARNSTSGLWQAYNDAGSSGINTAVAVLDQPVAVDDFLSETNPISGGVLSQAIIGGEVFKTALVGYDANALTDLKGREIVDALGVTIVKF